jgi:hypothetical protein
MKLGRLTVYKRTKSGWEDEGKRQRGTNDGGILGTIEGVTNNTRGRNDEGVTNDGESNE